MLEGNDGHNISCLPLFKPLVVPITDSESGHLKTLASETLANLIQAEYKINPIIQSEVSQKDKHQYSILTHIYGIQKDGNNNPICKTEKETEMYRTDFWTLWEKASVVCF